MNSEVLEGLMRAGEGPAVEWKWELPVLDRIGATFSAFANGTGGHLVVGLKNDGTLTGVADPGATEAALHQAASRLLPPQEIGVHRISIKGRVVIVAMIPPALKPPVLMWHEDGTEVPYIRDGSSTCRARKEDLRAVRSAMGRDTGEDDLDANEVRALQEILTMKNTALKAVVSSLRRGRREGRNLLKGLQRRGYLVRSESGRFSLTPFAHRALDKRR